MGFFYFGDFEVWDIVEIFFILGEGIIVVVSIVFVVEFWMGSGEWEEDI